MVFLGYRLSLRLCFGIDAWLVARESAKFEWKTKVWLSSDEDRRSNTDRRKAGDDSDSDSDSDGDSDGDSDDSGDDIDFPTQREFRDLQGSSILRFVPPIEYSVLSLIIFKTVLPLPFHFDSAIRGWPTAAHGYERNPFKFGSFYIAI
ncbi:hypothetical protein CROQUDRAFT_716577 [Cronartium quercuum f. sp. fusiforme G11]|uniref:Uncharacterized protein n=1 Tax=Cronartium quercuum f. sp. fusiforme G11 TaxID=708437 RepID=A0A9P6NJD1_9BASI|nr:hypothetical protein CROQUDRAFT_716577 [Cronartium quercuum f. sp. fusiforme G11]